MKKYLLFACIVFAAVVADQATKVAASNSLASQTTSWTHSITLDVRDDQSGMTMEQWARDVFHIERDEPKEERTLRSVYLTERNAPDVRPRRLLPGATVRGGDTLEVRYRVVNIIDGFWRHTYARNPGAAFGFLAGSSQNFSRPFFIGVSVIALLVILSLLRGISLREWPIILSLSFITGGALGNLIDRLLHGYVIDFIEWYVTINGDEKIWPTFNVADSFITAGVILMIGIMLFGNSEFLAEKSKPEEPLDEKSPLETGDPDPVAKDGWP